MLIVNITNFRNNIFGIVEKTIKFNEPVSISTKDGNAVLLSEDDYNSLLETMNLTSIKGMEEKIVEGLNTPLSECVQEGEVQW